MPTDLENSPPVSVATISNILNLTGTRVRQLANDGVIKKLEKGRYDLWASVEGYIKYLQDRKLNQWSSRDEDKTDLKREQLRRTKEEADKLHLSNERSRGELVELVAVQLLAEKMIDTVKVKILNMPLTDEEQDSLLAELLTLREIDW